MESSCLAVLARIPGALWVVGAVLLFVLAAYAIYYLIFKVGKGPQD